MKIALSVAGLGLALASLVLFELVAAKSARAADDGPDSSGFHREVAGNRLISIKPLVQPVSEQRPVRKMSGEDMRNLELEKTRPRNVRLRDLDERDLQREAAGGQRPVRLPQTEPHRIGEESNRPGLRLIYRPAPGQGADEVEVVR